MCEKWWHAGCVKVPENVYKVLGKLSSLHWMFVTLAKLNERVDELQLQLQSKANKVECSKVNDRVKNVKIALSRLMTHFVNWLRKS